MMATFLFFVLSNVPMIMLITALVWGSLNALCSSQQTAREFYVGKLLFFAVGISGIWGFVLHAFFPTVATQFIGWVNSPFQFEVAAANLGMGVAGLFGLHASRDYRVATTIFTTCFLWGAAADHVSQMMQQHNFSAGNAGAIFYTDILIPLFLILFLRHDRSTRY